MRTPSGLTDRYALHNAAEVGDEESIRRMLASQDEASRYMVEQLLDYGVRFIVCGQSAAAQGIAQDDMIPGVEMALSAMTAHALLQQRGYTVNPF